MSELPEKMYQGENPMKEEERALIMSGCGYGRRK